MTEADHRQRRALWLSGLTYRQIGDRVGASRRAILMYGRGRNWRPNGPRGNVRPATFRRIRAAMATFRRRRVDAEEA
ncbi:MAG: hypothetical protein LPK38_01740, partial [Actinomycetes bacterium]|nr:hypothetical protein [Actinomycetes bacterium]MDX5449741.1 hypothetical protein [Actinomycetes bacterium]